MKRLLAILVAGLGWGSLLAQAPPGTMAEQPRRAPEGMRVAAADIDRLLKDGEVVLLDVREPEELEAFGTRPGYINIPVGELEQRLSELPKDKTILTA